MKKNGWVPPKSPIGIIQEDSWPNEWHALVQCILLNCTGRKQVEKLWPEFSRRFPTPQSLLEAPCDDVRSLVSPLGFKDRRTKALYAMSRAYLSGSWSHVRELPGIGEYASRMWEMIFCGHLGEDPPKDHALVRVWKWMKMQNGVDRR